MADRPIGEHRDVGGAAADVDQAHAQVLLVFGQHRHRRGERLQDQVVDFEAAAAHALHDVLRGRHRAGHDVHLDFQAHAAHAERLAHVLLAVDDEFLVEDVQDLLVGGDVDRLRGLDHAVDVELRDLAVLDRDHAVRVEAADVAAGDAGDRPRVILQSAISSASSSARWIASTVASMFTTTPFLQPPRGMAAMPITSKPPSGVISATMATIFEVPMSRPTIRFLLSLGLFMSCGRSGSGRFFTCRAGQRKPGYAHARSRWDSAGRSV